MHDVSFPPPHRVAFITGGLKLGGATTFLVNLAGGLIQRGVASEVFNFALDNPLAADFAGRNIPVLCQDERRMIFEDRLLMLLEGLAWFKPTTVVANLGSDSFEVFRYLPSGIFRLGVVHSDDTHVYTMVRHYVKHMDSLAVVSRFIGERLHSDPAFARQQINQLSLGVIMPEPNQVVRPDASRPIRILYLGRLAQEQKRVQLFPEILRQLCASGLPFHWTIAGDGPDRAFLEANMDPVLPGQTVSFAGSVPYAKVPAVLQEHDVFLLASDYEGLPLSLLEAMGHGLVPVVSDLKSGIPEVVDARTGILVPVNDVVGYARAIVHLHEHRDELAAKSVAARERVQREFSVAAMTDRWLAVLPAPPAAPPVWPQRWEITAPLPAKNLFYFSPPMRVLRRIALRLQN